MKLSMFVYCVYVTQCAASVSQYVFREVQKGSAVCPWSCYKLTVLTLQITRMLFSFFVSLFEKDFTYVSIA